MSKIEELKLKIQAMEQVMFSNEMSDNFYYTSGRHAKDKKRLEDLKKQLKEMWHFDNCRFSSEEEQ